MVDKNMMKCFLGCSSSEQNMVKFPLGTKFGALVRHHMQQVPYLLFSPLLLKHPEFASALTEAVMHSTSNIKIIFILKQRLKKQRV